MKIILYTTHCPMCTVLEEKLQDANFEYDTVEDPQEIIKLGYRSAPILSVDENTMTFKEACNWIEYMEDLEMEKDNAN